MRAEGGRPVRSHRFISHLTRCDLLAIEFLDRYVHPGFQAACKNLARVFTRKLTIFFEISKQSKNGESQPWWCCIPSRSDRSPTPRNPQDPSGWSPRNVGWPRMRWPEVPMGRFREIPIARLPGSQRAPDICARPSSADGYLTLFLAGQSPDRLSIDPPVALWSA